MINGPPHLPDSQTSAFDTLPLAHCCIRFSTALLDCLYGGRYRSTILSHVDKRGRHETNAYVDFKDPADINNLPPEHENILGENPIYVIQDTGIHRVRKELSHASFESSKKRGRRLP